jgi:hypothetical protein
MIGAFFCNEVYFVVHGFPHGLPTSAQRAVYSPGSKWPRPVAYASRALNLAAIVLFALGLWPEALLTLLPSLAAWITLFTLCKHAKTDPIEARHVNTAFGLCHVGVLNWLLDIPAGHTDCARVVRILLNLTAAGAFTLGILLASPLERAWGCYGDVDVYKLTQGYCADHYVFAEVDGVVSGPHWYDLPACYTPLSVATRCGTQTLDANIGSFLDPYVDVGIFATAGSVTLYAMAFYGRRVGAKRKIN